MEDALHKELSTFLSTHKLADAISNIDEIVLSYLLGIIELISQGEVEDCFDLEDVMDMMNAYLPGFDQISSADVMQWMFGLAETLMKPENGVEVSKENGSAKSLSEDTDLLAKACNGDDIPVENIASIMNSRGIKKSSFPSYNFTETAVPEAVGNNPQLDQSTCMVAPNTDRLHPTEFSKPDKDTNHTSIVTLIPSSNGSSNHPSMAAASRKEPCKNSKRKSRQLSCSSQDSQEDCAGPKNELVSVDNEDQVRCLLEMFPAACTMEAKHCLQLSNGDMDQAVQLIIDRQEMGQAIIATASKTGKKKVKSSKLLDSKLDDDMIKSSVLQKYSFIDTEEDKKTYKPPPLKKEAKKLVRYRDGQIVSMKGERFSEVKKSDTEEMKATYVNLKPARKYRFH